MAKRSIDTIVKSTKPSFIPVEQPKPELPIIELKKDKSHKAFWMDLHRNQKKLVRRSIITIVLLLFVGYLVLFPLKKLYDLASFVQTGKYLVLFQNNSELRGGGGFLGTFAVVDFKNRKLTRYYFEANIYKKDNEFTSTTKIPAPAYFQEVFGPNVTMALRDSNYPSDFAQAAANVSHFYELEYGQKVNGVVAINASLVQKAISLTGPITVKSDNVTVTKDNFFNVVQEEVDKTYFTNDTNKTINEPKSILKDMVSSFLSKLSHRNPISLYNLLSDSLREKDLLFWFKDPKRQSKVEENNWGGRIKDNPGESIFVSNNNIGGEKSSLSVSEAISLTSDSATSLDRLLTITRTHNGGTNFGSNKDNKDYLKAYLPSGINIRNVFRNSQPLTSQDFTVTNESGKTVIGLWATTTSGQTTAISVDYSLPNSLPTNKILYQKQPGVPSEKLFIKLGQKVSFNGLVDKDTIISK